MKLEMLMVPKNHNRSRALKRADELVAQGTYTTASRIAAQHGISTKQARDMMGKPDLQLMNGTKPIFMYLVERVPAPAYQAEGAIPAIGVGRPTTPLT